MSPNQTARSSSSRHCATPTHAPTSLPHLPSAPPHRARRLADGVLVVVKEINTTSLSAKQKAATMDEVLVLSKLSHPNIVKYHDCYSDAVYINIVMEYCNAGDLAGLIKGREGRLMPEEEVMSLFVQVRGGGVEGEGCCMSAGGCSEGGLWFLRAGGVRLLQE